MQLPQGQNDTREGGWQCVSGRKGHRAAYVNGTRPPLSDITSKRIRTDYDAKMKQWKQSTCRRELVRILERQRPDEGWCIDNAACLAIGHFSRDNWEGRQRSMWQFVLFMDVVQYLRDREQRTIELLAQEIEFSAADRAFLEALGFTVIDAATADQSQGLGPVSRHLKTSSFVFEPFMEHPVPTLLDLFSAEPRLYIGTSLRKYTVGDGYIASELR